MAETIIEHADGINHFGISTDERTWKNRLAKLAEANPECECVAINPDGSVFYRVPLSWVRIRPPKKSTMTDEQKAESAARLRVYRERKENA